MKRLIAAVCVSMAVFALSAAESVFKKAQGVWVQEPELAKASKSITFNRWIGLDESETILRIASDRPVKVNLDWNQIGWIPGDGKAHDLPLFGGKGVHCLDIFCASDAKWLRAEVVNADGKVTVATGDEAVTKTRAIVSCFTKKVPDPENPGKEKSVPVPAVVVKCPESALAPGLAPSGSFAAFKCTEGKHWLYRATEGKKLVFKTEEKVCGVPSASIYCSKPGSITVKWGKNPDESRKITCEKEGGANFVVMDAYKIDTIEFIVDKGEFELINVGCHKNIDSDLLLTSLVTSDQKLNAEFLAARDANDRDKVNALIAKSLGLKGIDKKAKTITIDPTVKNGLTFCGAKICLGLDSDSVADLRWMRDAGEGLATDSSKLPEGWKLIRDFDMQAECQRLVEEAIADGVQGGIQF